MRVLKLHLSHTLDEEIVSIYFHAKGQIGNIYKVHTALQTYILKTSESSLDLSVESKY